MQLQRSCGVSGVGGKAASGRAARVACPQQRLQHKRAASAAPASNAQQWRQHAAARGALVTAAAAAQQQQQAGGAGDDDGEIDPMTGQVVARTSALSPVAGFELEAGGLRWAYRRAEVDAAAAAAAVAAGDALPDVLLLHGLGSSSYSFRRTLALLGAAGVNAVAPDWPGHGDSAKPAPGGGGGGAFDYSEAAFVAALDAFVAAADLRKPLALVVQGSVLPQYALLWAAGRPDLVERLVVLNTPLSPRAQLRPELAAYKNPIPFLRPKADAPFDGTAFNMAGSPYAMQEADALAYGRPYRDDAAASAAVAATMARLDSFPALVARVDEAFARWRRPSLLLFGANDPFVDTRSALDFLETKRTNMRTATIAAKLGHMPQEDYPEALHEPLLAFLRGAEVAAGKVPLKMTKRGLEGGA